MVEEINNQNSQPSLLKNLINLNFYKSGSTNEAVIRREILSTRLFTILLSASIVIITIYASTSLQEKTEKVMYPSEIKYRKILSKYPYTVKCFCSEVSIPFENFLHAVPTFHQVCSSGFVSQPWLDFTFNIDRSNLWPMDVRNTLSAVWQLITAFCQESATTFLQSLDDFQDSSLISSILMSPDLLQTTTKAVIDTLRQTATDRFLRSAEAVRLITLAADYMTGVSTNFFLPAETLPSNETLVSIPSRTIRYVQPGDSEVCYCQRDGSCEMPSGLYSYDSWETLGIFDLNIIMPNQTLPGLVMDCLPLQIVFSSTLQCFYDQSCLDLLISAYPTHFDVSILNTDSPSRFQPTDTVKLLIENIFIEEIINELDYTSYYRSCKPNYCTYTFAQRFDWSYTVTMIISLFGGLNVALRFICPYMIGFLSKFKIFRIPRVSSHQSNNPSVSLSFCSLCFVGQSQYFSVHRSITSTCSSKFTTQTSRNYDQS